MLVLIRKQGERIAIRDPITIAGLRISSNQHLLAIDAPGEAMIR